MTADLFISLSSSIKYTHTHTHTQSMLLRAYKLKVQIRPKIQKMETKKVTTDLGEKKNLEILEVKIKAVTKKVIQ